MDSDFPPIGDYAFISDCRSLALVSLDGSVEWACFGRFDSDPVFSRILDRDKGGHFRIAPTAPYRVERRYVGDTNVLETRFRTDAGSVTVTDVLPLRTHPDRPHRIAPSDPADLLIRVVTCEDGPVEVELTCAPRFDYGLTTPAAHLESDDLAVMMGAAHATVLQSDIAPLQADGSGRVTARTTLEPGTAAHVAFTSYDAAELDTADLDAARIPNPDLDAMVAETLDFWNAWSARCAYEGPHRDDVIRSALVLKGLTNASTGAVIAAATTSLPEEIGGVRNWDYRFTWLRDSVGLLVALVRLGYFEEAEDFGQWVRRTTAGRADELQIMYGIGGERLLHEVTLDHLSGYRGSQPARVGNGAWDQFQLDTFGEVVAATWFVTLNRLARELPVETDAAGAAMVRDVVDEVVRRWDEPDEGIWEVRGGRQHFTFSKLMAWVALQRGIELAELLPDPDRERLAHYAEVRDEIRRRIETEAVDPETGAFTQALGSRELDASTLQVPLQGFVAFDDPRVLATIDEIDEHLTHNGLTFRYLSEGDGLAGGEGAFVICTFWLIAAMARSGQVERAEQRFAQVVEHCNDVGLLAEEIDPVTGEHLGNFPQAFSHMGLILAALAITQTGDERSTGA